MYKVFAVSQYIKTIMSFRLFFSELSMMTNECLDCKMSSCRIAVGETSVSTLSSDHTGKAWNYGSYSNKKTNTMDERRLDKTKEVPSRWCLKKRHAGKRASMRLSGTVCGGLLKEN